jgi:prepilin-type processing-associated H-X9-DG protein
VSSNENAAPPGAPPPRLSRAAVASLVLGLATPVGWAAAGLAALVLGWQGVRAVNLSDGRLRGRRLAVAGMVLGGLGVAATALGLLVVFLVDWQVKSQRAECLNNLRQIGSAAQAYHDDRHAFPPGTLPNAGLLPERRLSWLVALPPYLQEATPGVKKLQATDDSINRSLAWDDPANAAAATTDIYLFRCPAHPTDDPRVTPGHTHYVGIAGVGPDAAALPWVDRTAFAAAVGPAAVAGDPAVLGAAGAFGYDRVLRRDDLTAGASRTLFTVETTHDNGPWTAGGPPTVRGVDPVGGPPIGPGRAFGGTHPGGANVLWADGSATFMRDDVTAAFFAWSSRVHRGEEAPAP